jgi:hypothetical protein
MQIFNNDFDSKATICREFGIDDFDGVVIYADYDNEGYEGSACVIFANAGKLWFAAGSHCSCFGLENSWEPEEVTVEQLRHIAANGYGVEAQSAVSALAIMDKFGSVEDPDALAAAVTLYFGGRH